jgi:hypothetical protein
LHTRFFLFLFNTRKARGKGITRSEEKDRLTRTVPIFFMRFELSRTERFYAYVRIISSENGFFILSAGDVRKSEKSIVSKIAKCVWRNFVSPDYTGQLIRFTRHQ